MKCAEKIRYQTQVDADSALREMKRFKRNRGRALRRLVTYCCATCGGWHVGHSGRNYGRHHQARLKPAPPQQDVPSWGALRRKLERLNRQIDRWNRHRAAQLAALIEEDRALAGAEESVLALTRAVEDYFLGPPVNR